ncbi:MAG TPA: gamma-glutamylcyclotransferase family protein [Pyrinomonadaceae bacterium]|nr:gamma-glutamylcyclotransferase family protein [Pyrinomonadaceae bacterium]
MDHEPVKTEHLFSYGTLQTKSAQLSIFGRRLTGAPDALAGYRVQMIRIEDQDFVAKSGAEYHRNLEFTGSTSDVVEGTVLSVTQQELEQADAYEPEAYDRVQVTLRSGTEAWVYLQYASIN